MADCSSLCAEGLARLARLFSEIRDIRLTSQLFGRVQLHRNNHVYDFLLKVCELIHHNLLVSEKSGRSRFRDFERDHAQMARLFEEFVRNFFAHHTRYRVNRENIYWRWAAADETSGRLLPQMQTDISLSSATRRIIIDCKFTPEATQQHFEAVKLRSSHLYQIHAYLTNLTGLLTENCTVMLLYPTTGAPVRASYADGQRRIEIRTINLDQPWNQIHRDLLALVE